MTRSVFILVLFILMGTPPWAHGNEPQSNDESPFESSFEKAKEEIQQNGQEIIELVDLDQNGIPEIRRIYSKLGNDKKLIRKEFDLNNDGKFDVVRTFVDGQLDKVILDLDYDGKADTVSYYRTQEKTLKSELVKREYDLQVDGKIGVRKYFVNQEVYKKEMDRSGEGTFDRFDYFKEGQLSRVEFDDNDDGMIDRWGLSQEKNRFPYMKDTDEKRIRTSLSKTPSLLEKVNRKPSELPIRKLIPKKKQKKPGKNIPRMNQSQ